MLVTKKDITDHIYQLIYNSLRLRIWLLETENDSPRHCLTTSLSQKRRYITLTCLFFGNSKIAQNKKDPSMITTSIINLFISGSNFYMYSSHTSCPKGASRHPSIKSTGSPLPVYFQVEPNISYLGHCCV